MSSFDTLPGTAFIRERQLVEIVGFSKATLWRRVKAEQFPQPVRFTGGRITAWRVFEVRAWLSAQGGAA